MVERLVLNTVTVLDMQSIWTVRLRRTYRVRFFFFILRRNFRRYYGIEAWKFHRQPSSDLQQFFLFHP